MKPSHTIRPVFDDPNLVSVAGLVPARRLAESGGLYDLLGGLTVSCANAGAKTAAVVGGMLGAGSIDDLDLLRHGGMGTFSRPATLVTRSSTRLSESSRQQPRALRARRGAGRFGAGLRQSAGSAARCRTYCWCIVVHDAYRLQKPLCYDMSLTGHSASRPRG